MKPNVLQKLKSKWKSAGSSHSLFSFSSNSSTNSNKSRKQGSPKWFKRDFTRLDAESYLADKEIGVFVVRKSETHSRLFVLSVRVPRYVNCREVSHYLVVAGATSQQQQQKTSQSDDDFDEESSPFYYVKGFDDKQFADLKSLVTHCSLMRDILPVMLNLDFYRQQQQQQYEASRESDAAYCFFSSPSASTSSLVSLSSQSEVSECESV